MRNKVLPAMLLGAGVAMGATQVLGVTPATAFGSDGPAAGETGTAADTPPTPDPVAVVHPIPGPAPVAAPVTAPPGARPAGARPAGPRAGDASTRTSRRAAPAVPPQRASGVPPQRPAAAGGSPSAGSGSGLVGGVAGAAGSVVSRVPQVVERVPEVVDRAPEIVNDTVSGAGEVAGNALEGVLR